MLTHDNRAAYNATHSVHTHSSGGQPSQAQLGGIALYFLEIPSQAFLIKLVGCTIP